MLEYPSLGSKLDDFSGKPSWFKLQIKGVIIIAVIPTEMFYMRESHRCFKDRVWDGPLLQTSAAGTGWVQPESCRFYYLGYILMQMPTTQTHTSVTGVPSALLIFLFQYASFRPDSSKAHYGSGSNLAVVKAPLPPTNFWSGPENCSPQETSSWKWRSSLTVQNWCVLTFVNNLHNLKKWIPLQTPNSRVKNRCGFQFGHRDRIMNVLNQGNWISCKAELFLTV